MNTKTLRLLAMVTAALLAIYILTTNTGQDARQNPLFIDGLKKQVNDMRSVTVKTGGDRFTLARGDALWTVAERDNFPADVAKLRALLLALADAEVVENKTSDPAKYSQIGVEEPVDEASEATQFTLTGDGFEHVVIIGKTAQGDFRYARLANQAGSVLINRNPDIPDNVDGWLSSDVIDIPADRINAVRIEHADGEVVAITKSSENPRNYLVLNIPAGRELTFETAANGIAGALGKLTLEDVRKPETDGEPVAVTTFETSDGLQIVARSYATAAAAEDEDEEHWVSFEAIATVADAEAAEVAELADGVDSSAELNDDAAADKADGSVEDIAAPTAEDKAKDINARVGGWQFLLPDYKSNLLLRRMDDLLKSPAEESDADFE